MQGNRAIILLLGAILVIVAGLVFLLYRQNIFNVIQNPEVGQQGTGPNSPTPGQNRYIVGASQINGYAVTVNNEADLINAIQTNHIFGRTFIYNGTQTTGEPTLETITFLLTDKRPDKEPEFGTADYVYLAQGTIQFNFYVTPDELSDPEFGNTILRKILTYTYELSYPDASSEEVSEAVDTVYNSLTENSREYITIEKI